MISHRTNRKARRNGRLPNATPLHGLAALLIACCLAGAVHGQKGGTAEFGIQSLYPAQQRVNEIITLTGAGFGGYVPGVCRVLMGLKQDVVEASAVYIWRDNLIQVRVPSGGWLAGPPTGDLPVWVVNGQGESSNQAIFQIITGPSSGASSDIPAFEQLTEIIGDSDVSTILGSPNMNLARTKDAEVGDVNGDGLMDLVDSNSSNVSNGTNSVVRLNNSSGGFNALPLEPLQAGDTKDYYTVVLPGGDFIGDSIVEDAELTDISGDNLPDLIQAVGPDRIRILVNSGNGFSEDSAARLPAAPAGPVGCPSHLDHADVDNDGDIDLLFSLRTADPICPGDTSLNRLFLNNGNGFFAAPTILSASNGLSTRDAFFIDANQDGFQDIVLVNENGSSQLFLNDGNPASPAFTASVTFASGRSGAAADLNGDGLQDFALAGNQIMVYLNSPASPGSFTAATLPGAAPGMPHAVELGDIDLNGAVDVLVATITANAESTITVWLNDANANFTNLTSPAARLLLPGVGPYQRLSAGLIDYDQDGDLDLYITGADRQEVGGGVGAVPNQFFRNRIRDIDLRPVAHVTAECVAFQCSFDGSGSFDDHGIVRYDWSFGDGEFLLDGPDQVVHTYAAAGEYTATLTVTDTIEQTDSDQVVVMPDCGDSIRPAVAITSPQEGDHVWGNFSVEAAASDNVGVTGVRFFVGSALQCIDNSPPFSCLVDGDQFPTAFYSLKARAFDACGNSRLSQPVNVRIVSNPEAFIDFPVEDFDVAGEDVPIQGWATDPDGVVSIDIMFDGQSTILAEYGAYRPDVCVAVPVQDPNCPNVGFQASFDSTDYPNGPHFIDVTATDASGLSTTLRSNFIIDNLPLEPCVPDSTTLCLRNNRFEAKLTFVNGAQSGAGQAVPWSDKSGIFWFFNPLNLEVGVKVLGPDPNGYWWVFHGAATDREYTLTVKDTLTGNADNVKTYFKPLGSFCGDPDTQAFPPDPPGGASTGSLSLALAFEDGMLPVKSQSVGSCVPGSNTLCLRNGRFEVEVLRSGVPQPAVPVTDKSGTFWFFDDENLELIVKVLGPLDGYWWVFYGSLTDRDFTLRVTDTQTGLVKEYVNSFGTYCGNGDTRAFPE